jgi:hypothetical protein
MAYPPDAAMDALQVSRLGLTFMYQLRKHAKHIGFPSAFTTEHIDHEIEVTAYVLQDIKKQLDARSPSNAPAQAARNSAQAAIDACREVFERMDDALQPVLGEFSLDTVPDSMIMALHSDLNAIADGLEQHRTKLLVILVGFAMKQEYEPG